MTATDELRRLLDERGVEYRFNEYTKVFEWHFDGTDGEGAAHATEVSGGINIIACSLTPEQAVEATLGRWTCHVETTENWLPAERYHRCKHCGAFFAVLNASGDIPPCVCPNCGRRVVTDG